jgi:Pancreatic hormone peptide
MNSAAATLLLLMGLIAPFSCDIALPINDDVYDLPNVYIGPNGEVVVRPDRPNNFISTDELKVYLDNLRSYYAMMGRPRSVYKCTTSSEFIEYSFRCTCNEISLNLKSI